MKTARIAVLFTVGVVLFILSYLSRNDGYLWLFYALIGLVFAGIGIFFTVRD